MHYSSCFNTQILAHFELLKHPFRNAGLSTVSKFQAPLHSVEMCIAVKWPGMINVLIQTEKCYTYGILSNIVTRTAVAFGSLVVWWYEFIFCFNLRFLVKYLYDVSEADIIHIFIKLETYEEISHSKVLTLW